MGIYILLTSAIFIFVKDLKLDEKLKDKKKIIDILYKISSCSFGVYLIHKIIMEIQIVFFNIDIYSWQWRSFGVITTYIISLFIILGLKKIPIIKKLVP